MKSLKIVFTDRFLNSFEGDQEELDAIVKELTDKFYSGEFEQIEDSEFPELTVSNGLEDFVDQKPRVLH